MRRSSLSNYRDVRDHPELAAQYPTVPGIIGIYEHRASDAPAFAIAEAGLYVLSDPVEHIAFADLADVTFDSDKTQARALGLVRHDGTTVQLRVEGGDGHLRDSYTVGHFIMRVLDPPTRTAARC